MHESAHRDGYFPKSDQNGGYFMLNTDVAFGPCLAWNSAIGRI